MNDKTVTVEVKNPTEKSGGIFSKSFILYDVITSPMNWNVQRRFSDFDALRQLLVKYYPSYHVPPLPGKKITNRRFETDFIMKRKLRTAINATWVIQTLQKKIKKNKK